MKKPPYTKKRGNVWWYRRPVPAKLRSIVGKVELAWSLDTSDMGVARTRAALRNAEAAVILQTAKEQFKQQANEKAIPAPATLSPAALRYIREAVRAHTLSEDDEVRRSRPDEDTMFAYESIREDQYEDSGQALASGRVAVGRVERERVNAALQAVGLAVPLDAPSWEDAAYSATEGLHGALQVIKARSNGDHTPTPERPAKPTELASKADSAHVLLLGHVIDEYVTKLKETTFTRKVRRCMQLFGEMVGRDLPVRELKQTLVTGFLRGICKLPAEWTKQYDKGVSIAAMLAKGADKGMSPTTYKDNYQAPLGRFLKESLRDYGDDGFPMRTVEGVGYTGTRQADEDKQRALTPSDLCKLYQGEQFAAIAKDPEQEALYWLAVVLLFTGARPRELCQMNPQVDFGQESDHWFMDLSATTAAGVGVAKSIKTGEARRIPLHPELIRLGFHEYLQRIKREGADRLFPSFRVKGGNAYSASGELFTNLLKAVGLYDDAAPPGELVTGAYVLRKTFITQCRNQRVISMEITGHDGGLTTEMQRKSYVSKVEPFAVKLEELRKLAMPVRIPKR